MQSLKHIKAYLFLHGKNVSKKAVDKFLSILQSDIKSGKITKAKDKYTKEVDRIQRSLVGMSNVMLPDEVAKVEIETPRKKHYERIVSSLGSIIPAMVSGAAGKVTEAIILNLFKAKTGLSGTDSEIVLNEGNGKIINSIYKQWQKIKNQKQHDSWSKKVSTTKFGTYGNIPFLEVLEKFEPKFPNDVIKRDFYSEIKASLSGLSGDISEAEKNKWIAIHTKQLEKAELDLEKANTKAGIIEAKKQIKWLKGALKNAKALSVHGLNGEVRKPSGIILSKDKAQKLCSDWHDGQNSALYQFASSKVFVPENFDKYIFEIESIQRHLATSTGKAYKDMQSLKKFFQYKNWELNKSGLNGKATLLASAPTEEKILAIINKYFYSTTFKLVDGVLHNSKGPVNNFSVEQKKGRYRFVQNESVSGTEDLIDFTIPTWALSAIFNSDESGMEEEDILKLNEFTDKIVAKYGNAHFMMGDESEMEPHFAHRNDIDGYLGADVVTLYLMPSKGFSGTEGVDLFEDHENIPAKLQKVLDKHSKAFEDGNYDLLAKALKAVEKIGYTFEYGLDGGAYDLRKIGEKGKSESIDGIKADEKKLRKSVKAKGIRLTHGYKLAKRKKGKKKSAKKKTVNPIKKVAAKKVVKKKTVEPKIKFDKDIVNIHNEIMKAGVTRTQAENILAYMGSIESIKSTPEKRLRIELVRIPGILDKTATKIIKYFSTVKTSAQKEKKVSTPKAPKSKVKASVSAAIADLLTLDKYKKYGAMFLGMFYSTFKNSDVVGDNIGDMKEKMFSKYEFDLFEHDYHANTIEITPKGKELIKAIEGRIDTLKAKKSGTDMFPELAGKKNRKISGPQKSARKQDGFVGVGTISETVDGVLAAMKAERSGTKTVATKKHNTHLLPVYRKVEVMPVENVSAPAQTQVQTSTVKTEGTMSGAEMGSMTFETLKFNDYYKGIFGSPATNFDMCIDGSPGSGKTTFLLMFANYLADFHGPTLFVTTEEFGSATLIDKVNRFNIKSKNLYFAKKVPALDELKKYKFVFIDSINHAKITIEQYQAMREKAAKTAFILVLQQTKSGSYKGSTDWPHEVEITMSLFKDEFDERNLKISKDRYTDPVPRVVKI